MMLADKSEYHFTIKRFETIKIYSLLFNLSILLFFLSCSTNKPEKKFKIGFSQCASDVWRQNMQKEMERELTFHPEFVFILKNANSSSEKQIKQIHELINEKIDLLIVSPNEAEPLTPIIDSVYKSNLPVIIVDRSILSTNYTSYIGASNYKIGSNVGIYANALLKGKGTIVEVNAMPAGSSADFGRHDGFIDEMKKYDGIVLKPRLFLNPKNGPFETQYRDYLKNNTDIDIIYCHDDRIAFEAAKACKELGIDKKIKIIGVDGLSGENGGVELVEKGIFKATILYPNGGKEAIEMADLILKNKSFRKENELESTVIDSTNVRIMKLQNQKVLAQQADIDKGEKKIQEQIAITNNQFNIIVAISTTLALALIFGGILFYYLQENKKINKKLELQKEEIADQRNQLIELVAKVKEATDAKFNFFTNISHEFRTPLTLILGPLEDVLSAPKLHFTIKNNLTLVHRNAIRLLRLINQLMDFRKIEGNKMKLKASQNNISEFVMEIADAFREIAKRKSISYNVISKVRDLNIWFDVNMLDKVLFNLLSNAFKFTNEQGTINVIVDKNAESTQVIIRVEDSGVGMTQEDIEHAFELFYQGHKTSFKGTGIGLSLSKELISLHHGTIEIKSEKGQGTTFTVTLPIGNSHLTVNEMLTEKASLIHTYEDIKIYTTDIEPVLLQNETTPLTQKEYSILVIEDNDDLRTFLKRRLSDQYEIHEAENGVKGITLALDIVPDLIISDIILPGHDGLYLTEYLKQDIRTSHIPIILLTAKGTLQEQIEGIKLRADAFIVKPFNLEYLSETIKNLLNNRAILREHYTSELPMMSRSNSSTKIDRKFINEFISIVENNISNDHFAVEDIYKKIGISRIQLYRKVKALIGYNVNDYILTVRLQKAKYLLANEDLSISEVTFKVGFSSQAYFSTVFKSKFSITPSDYKESKKTHI